MSAVRQCTPPLDPDEQQLLFVFSKLNASQKRDVINGLPAPVLPALQYAQAIAASPHFQERNVVPAADLAPLPQPSDKRWLNIPDEPLAVYVVDATVVGHAPSASVLAAQIMVEDFELTLDAKSNIVGIRMLAGNEPCVDVKVHNWGTRSCYWTAAFPKSEDKAPFRLGNTIQIYFDKTQAVAAGIVGSNS